MDTRLRVAAAALLPVLLLGCDGILDEPERPTPGAPLEAAIVPGANLVVEADLQAVRRAPIFAVLAAMAQGGPEDEASEEDGEQEFDEDMEMSEEEGEGKPGEYTADDRAMNFDDQNMPPPVIDPEDIFKEEAANNEARDKGRSRYQSVEKDW